jgi:hypothetical protein
LIKKIWSAKYKTKRKGKENDKKRSDLTPGPTITGQAYIGLEARNAWA